MTALKVSGVDLARAESANACFDWNASMNTALVEWPPRGHHQERCEDRWAPVIVSADVMLTILSVSPF